MQSCYASFVHKEMEIVKSIICTEVIIIFLSVIHYNTHLDMFRSLTYRYFCAFFSCRFSSDGSLFATEARDGRNAPSAAAPLTHWCCPSPGSAAHATSGSPEGDLTGISLPDWTGDSPRHCDSHHGDLPDCTSNTGTDLKLTLKTTFTLDMENALCFHSFVFSFLSSIELPLCHLWDS